MSVQLLLSWALLVAMAVATLGWWRARMVKGRFILVSGALVVTALSVELVALLLRAAGQHNTWLYNAFAWVEFLMVLRLAALILPQLHRAVLGSAALGTLGMAVAFVRSGDGDFLLVEGLILLALITCGWSLAALWRTAQKADRPLVRSPSFWFFLGTLVYFGGIVPFVGLMRTLYLNDQELTRLLYAIITVLAVTRYLLAAYGFHLATAQRTWDEPEH